MALKKIVAPVPRKIYVLKVKWTIFASFVVHLITIIIAP